MEECGWVQISLGFFIFFIHPKIPLNQYRNFWSSRHIPLCILSEYNFLIKVVSYYDLSVLFMSVMGFQKSLDGVGEWGELYPIFFRIF